MRSISVIAIVLIGAFGIYLSIADTKKDNPIIKSDYSVSGMHYKEIDGQIVNISVDSLECVLIKMEIEKRNKNDIFSYSLKNHKK